MNQGFLIVPILAFHLLRQQIPAVLPVRAKKMSGMRKKNTSVMKIPLLPSVFVLVRKCLGLVFFSRKQTYCQVILAIQSLEFKWRNSQQ